MRYICVVIFSVLYQFLSAQELNCRVEINASQIDGTNKSIFETLTTALNEYVNTNKWSDAQFSPNEKIEANIFIAINDYDESSGRMKGSIQVQSVRPVYNSTYVTTLLNFKDNNVEFSYIENEPLVYSDTEMQSQLTAIIDFYVNLILALDFDSFSDHGGDVYIERMERIVHQAQSAGESGWRAFEDTRNRAAVLNALTNPTTSRIRDLYYTYHLRGLDQMSLSPDKGRGSIAGTLDILKSIYKVNPMSVALSMFRDAKLDELINIYSKGTDQERQHAYEILSELYPAEGSALEQFKYGFKR